MADSKRSDRILPERPDTRPLERFWPYSDLPEQPTDEEIARVDPELREALFGPFNLPFSVTLVFPEFEGAEFAHAIQLAEAADEHTVAAAGGRRWHRARFFTADRPIRIRDLYFAVAGVPGNEVLINDRRLPYARELWLPMVWLLIR
jgi:hypothetical protein